MPQKQKKPKLGQNFLVNFQACAAIADALGDLSQRTVVEIGPGRGAITEMLAARARRLIAIELDRELAPLLRERFAHRQQVSILEMDVLDVDFNALREGDEKLAVVGNLPYYITSDILLRLFEYSKYFETLVILVQREVADRIAAEPGSSDYGLLSATAQLYASVEKLFTLPPDAFAPPPKVHSTVLRLTMAPRQKELGLDGNSLVQAGFIDFLKLSFGQKRKTLWNNLKSSYSESALRDALSKARVKPAARAETLSLEESAALYHALRQNRDDS